MIYGQLIEAKILISVNADYFSFYESDDNLIFFIAYSKPSLILFTLNT